MSRSAWCVLVCVAVVGAVAPLGGAQERKPPAPSVEQRLERLEGAVAEVLKEVRECRTQSDEALRILRVLDRTIAESNVRVAQMRGPGSANQPANQGSGEMTTNEASALGSLRSLTTAQEQFRQQRVVDQDGDGVGEYGWLGELAGVDACRVSRIKLSGSPFVAPALGAKGSGGCAQRNGYYFRVFLPTASGPAKGEIESAAGLGVEADADSQEIRWVCYAWPVENGRTGRRTFVASSAGEVYTTAALVKSYSGLTLQPEAAAAFDADSPGATNLDAGVGLAVAGLKAVDGNLWIPAGN